MARDDLEARMSRFDCRISVQVEKQRFPTPLIPYQQIHDVCINAEVQVYCLQTQQQPMFVSSALQMPIMNTTAKTLGATVSSSEFTAYRLRGKIRCSYQLLCEYQH